MTCYRSTTLKLWCRCPKALWHYEHNTPRDYEIFAVGKAAHAVLQRIGEAGATEPEDVRRVADETLSELITVGTVFDGAPEPPMAPEAAIEGRDIAARWASANPISPSARFEQGLAIRADGSPCAYDDPDARYKAAIDLFEPFEDETEDGDSYLVAQVDEYKTAWPTSKAELATVQTRGHAVLMRAHYPEASVIRRRVINLRTWGQFSDDIMPGYEEHAELLEQWRADLLRVCDAADQTREARPGAHCLGCDYAHACEDVSALAVDGRASIAAQYVAAKARADALAPLVRSAAKDTAPIEVEGGSVGYIEKTRRRPTQSAARDLAIDWHNVTDPDAWGAENARWLGLLYALDPGVSSLEKAARALYPGRDNVGSREALLDEVIEEYTAAAFGVERDFEI